MKVRTFLLLACVLLSMAACTVDSANLGEQGRVMWDAKGRAYLAKIHMGNVYTVDPLPDANRPIP